MPNIGRKYATVEVFTAPIFSIRYTYPKNANQVEIDPSQAAAVKAFIDGIWVGKLSSVNGIIIKALKTIDHPIKTNLSVCCEYFCINTVEKE